MFHVEHASELRPCAGADGAKHAAMTRTIAVANQKGGVGKTTTVVNLATFAALTGRLVVVVDLDPQGNASSVLAPDYEGPSVFGASTPQPVRGHPTLFVMPRGDDLMEHQHRWQQTGDAAAALKERLDAVAADADLIFIDCPPSLAVLPGAALLCSDQVLIPIQCEYYAMEGLGQILTYIAQLEESYEHAVELAGVALTMYDESRALDREVAHEIRTHFPGTIFTTPIPRDVALAAAPSHARSILDHDPLSPGGLAYLAMTKELLDGPQ